jgi:hypothetical protein
MLSASESAAESRLASASDITSFVTIASGEFASGEFASGEFASGEFASGEFASSARFGAPSTRSSSALRSATTRSALTSASVASSPASIEASISGAAPHADTEPTSASNTMPCALRVGAKITVPPERANAPCSLTSANANPAASQNRR